MAAVTGTSIRIGLDSKRHTSSFINLKGVLLIENPLERKVEDLRIFIHRMGCETGPNKGTHQQPDRGQPFARDEFEYFIKTFHLPSTVTAMSMSLKHLLLRDGSNLMTLPQGSTTYPFSIFFPYHSSPHYQADPREVRLLLGTEILYSSGEGERTRTEISDYEKAQEEQILVVQLAHSKAVWFHKNVYCWPFLGGRLWAHHLELSYQPNIFGGETLDLWFSLKNTSSRSVTEIKAYMKRVTKLGEEDGKSVSQNNFGDCWGGKRGRKIHVHFKVPWRPPTELGLHRWNHVEYFLCLEVKISGWFKSSVLSAQLPIVIGIIPRRCVTALPADQNIVEVEGASSLSSAPSYLENAPNSSSFIPMS